jgi:hypothetical protein
MSNHNIGDLVHLGAFRLMGVITGIIINSKDGHPFVVSWMNGKTGNYSFEEITEFKENLQEVVDEFDS